MNPGEAPCSRSSDIATRLSECKEAIIQTWVERVRRQVPAAQNAGRNFLVNSLPHFLDELIQSLSKHRLNTNRVRLTAAEHAEQRHAISDFTLTEILAEYKTLRQVVIGHLEDGGDLPVRERDLILDFIQTGMITVATEYAQLSENRIREANENERESRDQFIATLSHDLKTPLTAARLSAQLLARKLKAPDQKTTVNKTLRNIDRVDKMIENLLDANLIRAGQALPIAIAHCDLVKIANDTVHEMRSVYGERFALKAPASPIMGYWSAGHLSRCLENLLTNAVKYGAPDALITVRLSDSPNWARIAVHNSGEPIPPEQLQRLFQPYQRSTSASRSGKKGWGLGLTLVKGVADAHKGKVSASSDADQGTVFTIELPKQNPSESTI